MSLQSIPKLVSVIVPVFNRAHLVGKTLDSILNQTYPFVEVIAVNDGSTDGSQAVLEEFAVKFPDRVVVINQANTGQVRARNNGITRARGQFIAFLDSDDTWEEEKLALQIPLFRDQVGLVYCAIYEVDASGKVTNTVLCEPEMQGSIYGKLLIRNRMTGGSVVVTREALDRVGMFDESFKAAENWDLWIRIAQKYQVAFVNQPLVRYLRHSGNMSQDTKHMSEATWAILQKHLPSRAAVSRELRNIYDMAYAQYYYTLGVCAVSNRQYCLARKLFCQSWRYRFLYKDSLLRILRTFLGTKVNTMLANIKQGIRR